MHIIPIAVVTLIFLVLTGWLWHFRPNQHLWLFGSISLGAAWGYVFFRLITAPDA
ncbi:MAG: hypothetical protein HY244_08740 [Rhizobiales bacterium]|nr:hypothetical protein [Hyphomicrobiales bacterium]